MSQQLRYYLCDPVIWKHTKWNWETVKKQLHGAQGCYNLTSDLIKFHQETDEIQYAHLDVEDPAKIAEKILGHLQGFNPFGILRHAFWMCVILAICNYPVFVICSSPYSRKSRQ